VTQKALAAELKLSPGRVSQLKQQGMPVDDLERARAWRALHDKEGSGHKSRSDSVTDSARSITASSAPRKPRGAPLAPDDPAGALARMRETERRSYELIDAALKKAATTQAADDYAALPGLIRSYNQAAVNSLDAERRWEKHCRSAGTVAPTEFLITAIETALEPLANQLDNLPRAIAAQANPHDPAVAEAAIGSALASLRAQIAATLRAPFVPPPDEP
jgi:hypothetical protein